MGRRIIVVVVIIIVLGQLTQRHGWLASRPQGRLARPLNQPAKFKGNDNCPFLPSWAPFLSKPTRIWQSFTGLILFYESKPVHYLLFFTTSFFKQKTFHNLFLAVLFNIAFVVREIMLRQN